ncbi:hypothetical protein GA0070607_0669 [Micromonospora coriariae]|uniref:Uncharacterized protein n=1 Tax=Micromonospora coriariae TaxID=285665 RepID=A0A1C4UI39_9ACTN|nr:hypothetical protein [Micromonospora coriariae]SCE71353.1 hypothetical protein GA0070607_0669 [Micromonospora coriariae]
MNADRMDQETAERLLGGSVEPSAGPRPVVLLLTAARAAPRPAELAGEDVAVLAFRRERHGRLGREPAPQAGEDVTPAGPRPTAGRSRGLAWFGARAAVAALALAVGGGVALAATNGPAPRRPRPPTATPAPADPPAAPAPTTGGGQLISDAPVTSAPLPPASVPPDMRGQCRVYQAVAADDRGRALDNPVFSGLVAAAGDRQRVAGYCVRVLAAEPAPDREANGRPETAPSRRKEPPGPLDNRPTPAGPDRTAPGNGRHSPPGGPPT